MKRRYINEFISIGSDILEYTEDINVTEILFSADLETPLTLFDIALYSALLNLLYSDFSSLIAQEFFSELLGAVC